MTRPLRIGLLTPSCTGYNALDSGIGRHFSDLAVSLAEEGHTVWIVTPVPAASVAPDAQFSRVHFESFESKMPAWLDRLSGLRWQLNSLAGLRHRMAEASRALTRCVAREQLDIVETTSSGLFAARYLRTRPRVRVVTRVSTTGAQLVAHNAGSSRWPERLEQRWEERLVHQSDGLITHTCNHREELCRAWHLPPEAFVIIPHGIEVPGDEQLTPPKSDDTIDVLFVGRFEHRKGIDVLLAVMPEILAANSSVRFTLIGQDAGAQWQTRFRARHSHLVSNRVNFLGQASAEKLRAAYRACDVLVAPSRYESFGLIYVEAMAWAKPVIGCRAGGVPEVIDDNITGLLAEPGDTTSLRNCLQRLVSDRATRERIGRAAREKVQRAFSRTILARRSAEYYSTVISSAKR